MKHIYVLSAFAALVLCSTAVASLYSWNDAKRPPLELADALSRAERLLGDDANHRYCVHVSLYGDETGEGKKGAWNLWFAAADGSKKHVFIDMQGNSRVRQWNGPVDSRKNEGRRSNLDDVRRRLEELFAKEGIAAEFAVDDGGLVVKHRTRTFHIHPEHDEGEYSDELQQVLGPAAEGIWLRLRTVNHPDSRQYGYDDGPYWRWVRGTYFLNEPGSYLAVDFRYGQELKYEIVSQIQQIFGKRAPR
jgi:hypothetical protein